MDLSKRNFLTNSILLTTAGLSSSLFAAESKLTSKEINALQTRERAGSDSMLTLAPGATTSDLCINWYSDTQANLSTIIKLSKKNDPTHYITVEGIFGEACKDKIWHKATITNLSSSCEYLYSFSSNGVDFSEKYTFKTPSEDKFSFAYVGDPQLSTGAQDNHSAYKSKDGSTAQGWIETMDAMISNHPDITFVAGVGDQVDNKHGDEAEYAEFFAPKELRYIPFSPAVGNHDRSYLFQYHFNFPNEQIFTPIVNKTNKNNIEVAQLESAANYYYLYNNALFVVLNTSAYPDSKQSAEVYIKRFEKVIATAVAQHIGQFKWFFVQHHKSTASVAQHVADKDIQYFVEAGFEKLMDKFNVDFVLGGHDHIYARSYPMYDGKVVVANTGDNLINPKGIIYFTGTTASGLKYYNVFDEKGLYEKNNQEYPYLVNGLVGSQNYLKGNLPLSTNHYKQYKTPGFIKIQVTANKVIFQSFYTNEPTISKDTLMVEKT